MSSRDLLNIRFKNVTNRAIAQFPVNYGVPLAAGMLKDADRLTIRLPDGSIEPVQGSILERHADGSARWLLLDLDFPVKANENAQLTLVGGADAMSKDGIRVEDSADGITVTTPCLSARISKRSFSVFDSYRVNNHELAVPGSEIVVEDLNHRQYVAGKPSAVRVTVNGPMRVVVESFGEHVDRDGTRLFRFRLRYTFRLHEPGVEIAYKFTNVEMPDTGVEITRVSVVLPTTVDKACDHYVRQCYSGLKWLPRMVTIHEPVEVTSVGSLSSDARSRYGNAADGQVVISRLESLGEDLSKYPHYLRPGNARVDMSGGLRVVLPWVGVSGKKGSAVAWFYEMGPNFPKALACEHGVFRFDIWPAWADPVRIRRGMSKEHRLFVSLSDSPRSAAEMEGVYLDHEVATLGPYSIAAGPVGLTLDPAYVRSTCELDLNRWLVFDEKKNFLLEQKLGSFQSARRTTAMGMLDYGDDMIPGWHTACNNDNDTAQQYMREYYRLENPARFLDAIAQARHSAHVDFIAFDPDPLRQGTMPAHCPNHTDGATYPSHMWVNGLLAVYGVTGDTDLRDAALSVGENMLRWKEQSPDIFYHDSRECGWPVLAWLRLHEFTGEARWLDACRDVFAFYRDRIRKDGTLLYELPTGMGLFRMGYVDCIAWRAMFFYWERTKDREAKDVLVAALEKVYKADYRMLAGNGWGAYDLFPAWAAYTLTGKGWYLEDNYDFAKILLKRNDGMQPLIDVMYYFNELDKRGVLEKMQ